MTWTNVFRKPASIKVVVPKFVIKCMSDETPYQKMCHDLQHKNDIQTNLGIPYLRDGRHVIT